MAKKGRDRRNYTISPEQFVRTWQTSKTIAEVGEKLGMPKPIVYARAHKYRREGVKLKKMKPERKGMSIDVDKFNKIIEEIDEAREKQ